MLITIGKKAQFQESGIPLRGQCQPYNSDWQLKIFEKGKTTVIFEGNYYVCRQLQEKCKNEKDIKKIKRKIKSITKEYMDDTQETAVITTKSTATTIKNIRKHKKIQ